MKECTFRKQYVEVAATHCIDDSVRLRRIVLATGPVVEIEDCRETVKGKARTTRESCTPVCGENPGKRNLLL